MSSQISRIISKVYANDTVHLPREIRKLLQLGPGDYFEWVRKNGSVFIVKVKTEG